MKQFLDELNPQQKEAVINTEGPALIIAGAGSGKTRVLTTRIAYLLNQGVDPFSILALTFTNKAASEMKGRIILMSGNEAKNLWMGTFHSVFARILRTESIRLGYPPNFSIYDTDDSKNVIKSILKEENIDPKVYKPSSVHARISACKNSMIKPTAYFDNAELMLEDKIAGRARFAEIYQKYNNRCFKSGAMDFDDLLLNTYDLLEHFPDVLYKYQHRFQYVLIDEFQDTNNVQYQIVKKIAASSRNICVVGDDSQSIYSFRGANIRNILDFEKDYPELRVFKLEQNYRSTANIVEASDSVIANNKYRLPKKLWTRNEKGNKIKVIRAESESDEANLTAVSILDLKKNSGYKNNDFVVLYRTNAHSRAFEEAFRRFGIDYRLVGSISFYQRKEIKDILAYLRFTLNTADEEALKRIINLPPRGIGDTTFSHLIVWANDNQCTIWDIINNIKAFDINSRVKQTLSEFAVMIRSFQIIAGEKDAFEAARYISKESGLIRLYAEDKTIEGISRYENIENLFSAIKAFVERDDDHDKSLTGFLQEVSLLTDADTQDDTGDKVTLMTVHSAKGLEFKAVFITGLEEGLFPSAMSMETREEIEEERRLFYVAVTRAMERLYLCYAVTRFQWGNLKFCEPSRFLDEIDPRFVDFGETHARRQVKAPELKPRKTEEHPATIRKAIAVDPDFVAGDVSNLTSGMTVVHNAFGTGKVLHVEGTGENKKAVIYFENFGQKNILLKFAKMKIISD